MTDELVTDEAIRRLRADLPRLASSALSRDTIDRGYVEPDHRTRSVRWLLYTACLVVLVLAIGFALAAQRGGTRSGLARAGPGQAALSPIDGAVVEIDLYSGRPNPTWVLSSADAARVWRIIGALEVGSGSVPVDQRLGLRGFSIDAEDGMAVAVHPGQVIVSNGGVETPRDDPDNQVMQELVSLSIGITQDTDLQDILRTWQP